ncbi:MAG: MipA/OmpV family protein, partial [Rhodocyclaceae bacterium]|nr:MipA/OmpV family protein [Rhodocyclaceae bacterium]
MAGIRKTGIAGLLLALIATMGGAQAADDKPLWEIGAGVAAFSFPSYRGSDQTNNFLLPVPHFTYHGDFLKAD